jgi:hypothetical protein
MDETVEHHTSESLSRPSTAAGRTQKPGIELLIGSNIFRNTNGVVKIHGKEQLVLESQPEQGVPFVTLDLYDETGAHNAHIRRNTLALNQTGRFSIAVDAPAVRIIDKLSGTFALEVRATAEDKIHIAMGKFYSHKGIQVEITPHYCRIGSGMTRFGDIVENGGGTVVLG